MKAAIVALGVVLLVTGIALAVVAQATLGPAQARLIGDCFNPGMDLAQCAQDAAVVSQWNMVLWLGVALAIVGLVVAILGAVYESIVERPAPPMAAPTMQTPMCPTCGRPIQFIPQYNRWYCPAENRYL